MTRIIAADPTQLGREDFDLAMHSIDIVLAHRAYTPIGGWLVLLLCKFRDDVRAAHQREPLMRVGRGGQVLPLEDLDSSELAALAEAVDTLLKEFKDYMDDPELPEQLGGFRHALRAAQAPPTPPKAI